MKQLWEAADFIRNVHRRLRFGDLSRAPLKLLRLEVRGEEAECEWMAGLPIRRMPTCNRALGSSTLHCRRLWTALAIES